MLKMTEEFNLSDNIVEIETQDRIKGLFILKGDIQEFIKRLKEEIRKGSFEQASLYAFKSMNENIMKQGDLDLLLKGSIEIIIDKLAGDKLI